MCECVSVSMCVSMSVSVSVLPSSSSLPIKNLPKNLKEICYGYFKPIYNKKRNEWTFHRIVSVTRRGTKEGDYYTGPLERSR